MPHNALTIMGAMRRFPKGDRKALWSLPQERNSCGTRFVSTLQIFTLFPQRLRRGQGGDRRLRLFSLSPCCVRRREIPCNKADHLQKWRLRRFPKGDRKALWSLPKERNSCGTRFVSTLQIFTLFPQRLRRGQGGDRKAPLSLPQERNSYDN